MSKTKKSKLLASMLCATVVAGLYAGPVMAGNQMDTKVDEGNSLTIVVRPGGGGIDGDTYEEGKDGMFNAGGIIPQVAGQLTIKSSDLVTALKGSNMTLGAVTADSLTIGKVTLNTENIAKWNEHMNASEDHFEEIDQHEEELEQRMQAEEQALEKVEDKTANITDVVTDGGKESTTFKGKIIADKFGNSSDTFWVDAKGQLSAANMKFYVGASGEFKAANGNFEVKNNGDVVTVGKINGVDVADVGADTAGIERYGNTTTIEESFRVHSTEGYNAGTVDVYGSMIQSNDVDGGKGVLNGDTLTLTGTGYGNATTITGGTINTNTVYAAGDVVANGTSLVTVGAKTAALENKTTAIEYTPGDPNGIGSQKLGTTTIKDKLNADIFSANQGTIGGVTMAGGAISAGAFTVDNSGNITANNLVTNKYDVNATFDELTDKMGNVSTITVIEDTPKGTITNISSHLNVQGDISANGDVTTKAGASLNGLNEQVKEDALKIHNLQVNTAGINRDGAVTTIEGATSFDADGMKMVGDNITDHVTINRNGSMEARNGDASFYFDKNSIALNNGNNSVMVGNESITLSTTGAALTMSKDGLDYADGAFKVAADGSVRIASGTENSITLDAKTGVIYANDFSTGEYSLNAIGDQLNELETGVGEDITDLKRKTTDIEYADGVTTIAGATKFTENGMQVGTTVINKDGSIGAANGNFTVTADGEVIVRGENGATSITGDAITIGDTVIKDGMITTHKAEIGGVEIANGRVDGVDVSELAGSVFDGSKDIAELQRITTGMDYQNGVTSFSGDITFRHNGDTVSLGGLVDKVNDIYDRTSGISKDENGNTVIDGGLVVDGDTTGTGGSITGNGDMNISGDGQIGGDLDVAGSVNAGNVNTGNINAGKGTIGGIHMENGEMTVGDTTVNGDGITVGGIVKDDEGKESGSQVTIDKGDVSVDWVDEDGNKQHASIKDNAEAIEGIYEDMGAMSNRISKVEDRIDKVGAMSAAIANLRTMGYDPTAPTEIAVGIGQYRSETGAALGLFHYPNKDFMLSLSVSTSGDEVMGGIGATWKFGRKTPEQMLVAEKEKATKAKLAKAEAMKKAAAEAKVAAQQAKHAKMAAEKAAK